MPDRSETKILLHICCAPCAEYPLAILMDEGVGVHGYYYNPNIHPAVEHRRREEGVRWLTDKRGIDCLYDDTVLQEIWEQGDEHHEGRLCERCYGMRMRKAAQMTRELGLEAFTTTLLVSPYQKHDLLRDQAEKAARAAGVRFLYRDFRTGFRVGQDMARADGLYRQKYCGCIDSLNDSRFKNRILGEHQALTDLAGGL